jgi:hypothetical protein
MNDGQDEPGRAQLECYFEESGMSYRDLWYRQMCLGGDASALELEAYLLGLLRLDPLQHDLIAQSLNEHFMDEGKDHPASYSDF